eukprot:CAMPEP_0174273988 /NCGR_PEP_ID=MMETSP0439-20130205/56514_1 /TAXON_ID=0 /ORGANISM="Stereomyxa ramosa, Strain Chinc5" /LENGTH=560 /DNA_ID=CAMNT_0015365515 /DNA_START=140 /DNA_END=1819 /DNA_ORIENTATION=+
MERIKVSYKSFYSNSSKPPTNKLFGVAISRTQTDVPIVIKKCITFLRNEQYLMSEGIFRKSGNHSDIMNLKARFDAGEDVILDDVDVHTVTGLLKLYLRELPEPLCTFELYDMFIAAAGIPREQHTMRVYQVLKVLEMLPLANQILIKYLVNFLLLVKEHSNVNKMSSSNIATVFAPNLIRPQGAEIGAMMEYTAVSNNLMELLISSYDELLSGFPDPPEPVQRSTPTQSQNYAPTNPKKKTKTQTVYLKRDFLQQNRKRKEKFKTAYITNDTKVRSGTSPEAMVRSKVSGPVIQVTQSASVYPVGQTNNSTGLGLSPDLTNFSPSRLQQIRTEQKRKRFRRSISNPELRNGPPQHIGGNRFKPPRPTSPKPPLSSSRDDFLLSSSAPTQSPRTRLITPVYRQQPQPVKKPLPSLISGARSFERTMPKKSKTLPALPTDLSPTSPGRVQMAVPSRRSPPVPTKSNPSPPNSPLKSSSPFSKKVPPPTAPRPFTRSLSSGTPSTGGIMRKAAKQAEGEGKSTSEIHAQSAVRKMTEPLAATHSPKHISTAQHAPIIKPRQW